MDSSWLKNQIMKTYIMGDVHGHLERLTNILIESHLIGSNGAWSGGDAHLWFIGDLVDRGPDGIGVIELVMRLQSQASAVGGRVQCLLGNHEIQMLAAHRFAKSGSFFVNAWRRNGGLDSDISRLNHQHIAWMRSLPAMARLGPRLLIHADATIYLNHAPTIDGVNASLRTILTSGNPDEWEDLIGDFSEHRAFASMRYGERNLRDYLRHFGGDQIVHGHTPIPLMADVLKPTAPFSYLDRHVVNVDGGMAMGAPGFIWQIQ